MESPCHWIDVAASGQIFIGSLTGDVFRWYRHWLGIEGGPSGWRGADPCREDEPAGSSSRRTLQVSATLRYPPAAASSVVAASSSTPYQKGGRKPSLLSPSRGSRFLRTSRTSR